MGLAALTPHDLGAGRLLYIAYWDPTAVPGPFREVTVTLTAAAALAIGAYSDGSRDHLVVIGADKWLEIAPNGSIIERPGVGGAARRILSIGPCDGGGADQLLVSFIDRSLRAFTTTGGPVNASPWVTEAPVGAPVVGGCVGDKDERVRTLVFSGQSASTGNAVQSLIADMDIMRTGKWPTVGAGAGFTRVVGDDPAYMLGAVLDLDGISLARFELGAGEGTAVDVHEVTSDDAPALVLGAVGGDFDDDQKLDVVQLLQFGQTDESAQYRLLFSLGIEHRGERLTGITGAAQADIPRLYLADFDGDGFDDLLIASPVGFLIKELGPSESD
jgi:hypothetical protein